MLAQEQRERHARWWAGAIAFSFASSCYQGPPAPVVDSVEPAELSSLVSATIAIRGQHFHARVEHINLDHPENSVIHADFEVLLVREDGDVALQEVVLVNHETLSARVPAGVPAGTYAVEVVDPHHRRATLPDALEVVVPADAVSGGPCSGDADCLDDPCVTVPLCSEGRCVYDKPPLDGRTDDCDGLDNDCDGEVDEDYAIDSACGVGHCRNSNTPSSCNSGLPSLCSPGAPLSDADTTCDGVDDDCDGETDEDYVPDAACGVGYCAVTRSPSSCVAGVETACSPGSPLSGDDVTCDGVDDDCDGDADDDYVPDASCGVGFCITNNTASTCFSGVENGCVPGAPAAAEDSTCDDVDDDCDGATDEDYSPDASCGVGWCMTTNTPSSCSAGIETGCVAGSSIPEVPDDGVDQDCSGADTVTCYVDTDLDGVGSTATILARDGDCADVGESATSGDCDDTLATGTSCVAGCVAHFADQDSDGYGNASNPFGTETCHAPGGFVANNTDCADLPANDPACNGLDGELCNPGFAGADTCDGANNDCDATTDEDPEVVWFEDADSDNFGNPSSTQLACAQPAGFVSDATDCADLPTADPACNGLGGAQCNPGRVGTDGCDGADNDCDGSTDEDADITWFEDLDGDGYGNATNTNLACFQPIGFVADNTDCADVPVADPNCNGLDGSACNPGLAGNDGCDGADNDCDTQVDEDGTPTWYEDLDGDGYGTAGSSVVSCTQPPGYSSVPTDCADTPGSDPACNDLDGAQCNPGRAGNDLCDGADNDCDGPVDEDGTSTWYEDADSDGYGSGLSSQVACSAPAGFVSNNTDCADQPGADPNCGGLSGALCNPGLAGTDGCDGADNDCDGATDEDPDKPWFEDADGDGFGLPTSSQLACAQPASFVADNTDCADAPGADPACNNLSGSFCHPGLAGSDLCDGANNDCDGTTDEDPEVVWYADADGDSYGDIATTQNACARPGGYVADNTDCADTPGSDPACNGADGSLCSPGLSEGPIFHSTCGDVRDNDCDGDVDDADADCQCELSCGACSGGCCAEMCGGGDCDFDCTSSACDCYFDCGNSSGTCRPSCSDSACDIDCSSTGTCEVGCTADSVCTIDCTDASTCALTCSGAGSCDVICTDASTCNTECTGGKQCLADCTGASTCEFSECSGGSGESSCPGNIIVCNRACP